ncbi:MAG: amidohydrolase family protein [Fimbriimonadales bacterium]|jgi:5-methylthioadenosine/S-adenosylhomocysteine deaminase|nr:amidohydrolase family protein [Fimbriimonadales bacterium]GIV14394.1 MAG: metal-dependent hydrolase [Fimbriimonadales bacterium]CUU11117.1 5-methylthioadenosine/S-adenosylhomocysteine deaminase [Armatimonadetes bacterium GBS]CUU36612.1 5-methylthioadenosine/S-adenosylhomocysteine deaminase [Armatimonadetes bacterium GXS]
MEHTPLILRANWILPISQEPLADGEVVVENGQIVEVRPRTANTGNGILDFGDAIILPGLINGHCHLEYTALRGENDKVPFFDWIRGLVALKAKLPEEFWLPSALLGVAECLASGITFVSDNTDKGVSVQALAQTGVRGRVYQEIFGIEPQPDDATLLQQLQAKLEAHRQTLQRYEASERVQLGVSPHAVYTVRDSLLKAVVAFARTENLPISMHAAESSEEVALTRSGSGSFAEMFRQRGIPYLHPRIQPLEYLHQVGVMGTDTQLVHCVKVEPREMQALAQTRTQVAHCPRSNARLLTGVAPIAAMRRLGIPIVVGTDSVVSAGTLDLWEEVRFGALAQRAFSISAQPTWKDWVAMVTLEAARAFGIDTQVGSLDAGKRADITVVRTHRLAFANTPDPYAGLVLAAHSSDVALTMVEGMILYQDSVWRTIDVPTVRRTLAEMRSQS